MIICEFQFLHAYRVVQKAILFENTFLFFFVHIWVGLYTETNEIDIINNIIITICLFYSLRA